MKILKRSEKDTILLMVMVSILVLNIYVLWMATKRMLQSIIGWVVIVALYQKKYMNWPPVNDLVEIVYNQVKLKILLHQTFNQLKLLFMHLSHW